MLERSIMLCGYLLHVVSHTFSDKQCPTHSAQTIIFFSTKASRARSSFGLSQQSSAEVDCLPLIYAS